MGMKVVPLPGLPDPFDHAVLVVPRKSPYRCPAKPALLVLSLILILVELYVASRLKVA